MRYDYYYEGVKAEGGETRVSVCYELGDEVFERDATVKTVSDAAALLRNWRAEFRKRLVENKNEKRSQSDRITTAESNAH